MGLEQRISGNLCFEIFDSERLKRLSFEVVGEMRDQIGRVCLICIWPWLRQANPGIQSYTDTREQMAPCIRYLCHSAMPRVHH
jgi:hypothetical protein